MHRMCSHFVLLVMATDIVLSLPAEYTTKFAQALGSPGNHRYRRQTQGYQVSQIDPNRQQWINNAFQIPIQTLQSVSNLLQITRPLVAPRPPLGIRPILASSAQTQQYTYNIQQYPYNQQNSPSPKRKSRMRPTKGAEVTGLDKPAEDGSSYKI